MRFAVKEDLSTAVKLPPSIVNAYPALNAMEDILAGDQYGRITVDEAVEIADRQATEEDRQRWIWDDTVATISNAYNKLVASGMPAEDARGLLPTNVLTRVHMRTDIKTLINMAGMRLCTQAQFEWREVFAQVAKAFRTFGDSQRYESRASDQKPGSPPAHEGSSKWQYDTIAQAFQPVCYRAGHCPMQASADRTCSIRNRVQANAEVGRKSSEWAIEYDKVEDNPIVAGAGPHSVVRDYDTMKPVFIGAIKPVEWLADPTAARQAPRN
jgi:hypothetical protein